MSNMHRLIWFDSQIRAMLYPNRVTLAEKFEISTRQAQRDIDYLKNSLGAPVEYDGRKRGYYYKDETYILPNVYVNDIQKKMLKFLAYRYENYAQTPKVALMSELFNKLANEGDIDDEIPIFDIGKPTVQFYYSIYKAIQSKNRIEIEYKEPYRGIISMRVDPYKLFYSYRADYLAAYDNLEDNVVVLRLDRIVKMVVLKENFIYRDISHMEKCKGISEREPYTARIIFEDNNELKEEKGIHVRKIEDKLYEVEFFDVEDFINILICNGYWNNIISPKWLKGKLIKRCEEIIEKLRE